MPITYWTEDEVEEHTRSVVAGVRAEPDKHGRTVRYDACEQARPADLPAPRLQFRWEGKTDDSDRFVCRYEMVLPLGEHDIRNDAKTGFAVVGLSTTLVGGDAIPWDGPVEAAVPFRDGSHAQWDSKSFGGLPIYCINPDGTAREVPPRD